MGSFVRKLFAPWTAEACFDDLDDFYAFLLRRNKLLNAVRVVFFLIAAACLMLGYAFEPQPYNSVAVGGASEPEVLINVYFTKIASVPKQRVGGD